MLTENLFWVTLKKCVPKMFVYKTMFFGVIAAAAKSLQVSLQ